jgi:hypothetical protein
MKVGGEVAMLIRVEEVLSTFSFGILLVREVGRSGDESSSLQVQFSPD